jgi:hypothetical protein
VSSDGYVAITTGTTHNVSYTVPADGPRTWHITCSNGIASITSIDSNTDAVSYISLHDLRRCRKLIFHTNSSLEFDISTLPTGLTYAYFHSDHNLTGDISTLPAGLTVAGFFFVPLLTGDISTLPTGLTYASFYSDSNLTGDISTLPTGLTIADFSSVNLLTGDISTLPAGLTIAYFSFDPNLTAGSISHLVSIRDIYIHNNSWNSASVDTVLLSVSNAIHVNVNHFTYSAPVLQIGGNNAAPGGTASAATTDPMVTPGSGNSDTDWQWDAARNKHKAISGMAAIWVMRNNTGHTWTVTATGVT